MDLWRSLSGMVTVQITSADPAGALAQINRRGIELENVHFEDELTLSFGLKRQDLKAVRKIADKRGEELKILGKSGLYWGLRSLLKRPVLIIGLAILVLLTVFLPTRIYFFRVEGNAQVPTRLILDLAADCGIRFGASRREVRSEKVKNALLQAIPELEWAGINTAGCVATISVRERQNREDTEKPQGISSIVAARDGVIQELTVTGGSASVKPGQAVKAGQVLISGYTDCGLSIRAERAKGEVYAATSRSFSFLIPEGSTQRGEITAQIKKYSLIIGKNRINFYEDSGNLPAGCVKIYEQAYVTLPGGFELPLAIVTETWIYYEESTPAAATEESQATLENFAQMYLRSQMVAGQILTSNEEFTAGDGVCRLDGEYGCLEMIGRERSEEIITP